MIFDEILEEIAQRSDGLLGVVIMGMDGRGLHKHGKQHFHPETCNR